MVGCVYIIIISWKMGGAGRHMTSLVSPNPREDTIGSNRLQKSNRSENANLGRMDLVRTRNEIAPEAKRRPRLSTDFEGVAGTRGRRDPIAFEDFRAEEFKRCRGVWWPRVALT